MGLIFVLLLAPKIAALLEDPDESLRNLAASALEKLAARAPRK